MPRLPAAAASVSTDPLRFGPIGIGADPSDVYTVHYRTLAAVVSDAPLEVLDSTRENVLAHERVNETVMREHTVIPMSFGTIFKTREDIVEQTWRVVQPALDAPGPIHPYLRGSWGPSEADRILCGDRWHSPR